MKSSRRKGLRVALVVLGMHRSGTSALAGALTLLGCDGPATPMKATPANAKGYFEPAPLYPLHSQLLDSAASSWDDWLPIGSSWLKSARSDEFHDRAVTLIQEQFGKSKLFVLKDPRICRLVPFWAEIFSEMSVSPHYILTHRNPLEVAQSLHVRDGMEIEVALLVWLRHVLDAEFATRGLRRCFTSYTELMTSWSLVAEKIGKTLDVALPRLSPQVAGEVEHFLSSDLRHQSVDRQKALTDARTSGWVQTVYTILEAWVANGETEADFETLDTVRAQFDSSATAFAAPLRQMQNLQQELRQLSADNARRIDIEKNLTQEVETLRAGSSRDAEARLAQQEVALEEAHKSAQQARKILAQKTKAYVEERERHAQEIAEMRAANHREHSAKNTELEMELAALRGALDERRMTSAQADAALATMRDKLIEREATHERALVALEANLKQRLDASAAELQTTAAELDLLRASAVERTNELQEVGSARDALQVENKNLQVALAAEEEALSALKGTLDEREAELAHSRSALEQRRHELDQYISEIAKLQTELAELQTTLQNSDANAGEREAALISRLTEHEAQARELKHSVDERTRELADLTRLIIQREAEKSEIERAANERAATLEVHLAEARASLQLVEENASERMAAMMERLAERETQARQLKHSADERTRELAALTQLIVQRDAERSEIERVASERVATLEAHLAEARATLQSAEKTARERASELEAERDTQLRKAEALQTRLVSAQENLQLVEKTASERVSELETERNRQLRKAEALQNELASARANLQRAEETASERVSELEAERDTQLRKAEALQTKLTSTQADLQRMEKDTRERETTLVNQVQQRDTNLRAAEQDLANSRREFAHLAQLIVARETERDQEARKVVQRGTEIETLRQQIAALEAERDTQEAYIADLYASRSWQVTRPLRSITIAMRRVLKGS